MNRYVESTLFAIALLLPSTPGSAQTSSEAPSAPSPATPPAPPATPPSAAPATPPSSTTTAAPAAAAPAAAPSGEPRGTTLLADFLAGARAREVSGSRDKFQEYGTVADGFLLESLRARYGRPGSGDFLELGLRDVMQDDESYRLSVGRQGRYRLSLSYDAIPHRFSGGYVVFSGLGTSRLHVPNALQSSLEAAEVANATRGAAPFSPSPGADLAQQSIVYGAVEFANPISFRVDRRRAGAGLEFALPGDAVAWVRAQHESRSGARVISAGTYERFAQNAAGVHLADRFIIAGNDLAEPLDYRTLGISAGAGIHKESWLADLEYTLTQFRNRDDVLLWDNPFRATDAQATPSFDPGPPVTAGGGLNRGRFATGNLGLPPDSLSHEISATGAVDLPMNGRLAASASYGMVTQDQAFQPYTRNGAVIAYTTAAADVGRAATLALPQRDLNGDVRTIAGSLSASVRPLHPMTVGARYRVYRYDGRSDQVTFPGYSAFGDSFWRLERADLTGNLVDVPVANEVFDYWRHEADVSVDYRVARALSIGVEGGWEGWRYDHLRVDKLDEYSAGASVAVRPLRNTSLKARYRFSDRTNAGYARGATPENPEARGLLNFNWADRRRHLADARLQVAPHRAISLGLLARFVDEDYGGDTEGGTVLDAFRFGRTDVRTLGGAVDVVVTPAERLSFFASYSYDRRKEQMASAAKDEVTKSNIPDPLVATTTLRDAFSPVNYWNSDIKTTVNTVGVGTGIQLVPEKLVLDARYSLSFSDMEVSTFNPNPVVTAGQFATLDNAVANDWPTIKSRLHEVTADLGYRLTPQVRAGVRYLFQSFDLDDFAWDALETYMAGRAPENTTRYLYADATYDAYRAHVGTVYVAGSF